MMGGCGAGKSASDAGTVNDLMALVDGQRYQDDLSFIAQSREPKSSHWQEVQDLCASRLTALGFKVERQTFASGVNVIGVRSGTGASGGSVVISAHYDHIAGCAGADDNASGVAGTLEAARVLATAEFNRTLLVACWDGEEKGMLGSKAYAAQAKQAGDSLAAVIVMDMIGFKNDAADSQTMPVGFDVGFPSQTEKLRANQGRADFIAVVADETSAGVSETFADYADAWSLPNVVVPLTKAQIASPLYAELLRSDQSSFWLADFPAIMVSDTGELRDSHYHCKGGPDAVSDLNQDFAVKVIRAVVGTAGHALQQ
jgi:Zn-dependent M28 family amino/carboxypeptidase